jgi:hypothetical protein
MEYIRKPLPEGVILDTLYDENPYNICVMLATRGRTKALSLCLSSLFGRASGKTKIQLIIAFDRDDYLGLGYFNDVVKHWLEEKNIDYTLLVTERYGYTKLNYYYNIMGNMARADWLLFWTDDAIMDTAGWDIEIAKYTGQFKILSVYANNEHPYSIFPIIPQPWVKVLGRVSRHQLNDTEVSQMAYLLDIFERIPVYVTHDRADLTGNNKDVTYDERYYFEGRPNDPNDFRHPNFYNKRVQDMQRLAHYMKVVGLDTSWWESCIKGENKEPFAKLAANDPNKQVNIGTEFKK